MICMVENGTKSDRCRFCNSSFSEDILNKIKIDRDDVYCENCGDIIKRIQDKYNFNPNDTSENEAKTNISDSPAKPQKELKPHPDALNYPIGRVFYDNDFPLTFKSNLILVFSRLTCFHALYFEREGQIQLGESEIPENALNDLYMSTRHVQDMRIQPEFLNNLRNISKDEFERNLKRLQAKIQSNRQYLEDFLVYSRWLIREVYLLISDDINLGELSKFNLTIYKDLENQKKFFENKLEQLTQRPINLISYLFKKKNAKSPSSSSPYKISSKKKIWIKSWLEHIPKDTRGYASIKLLSDLQIAIQKQSQKLAKLFPHRVSRFKLSHLSKVIGISDNILRQSRSSKFTVEKSLKIMELIEKSLINKYNKKDIELSLLLIEKYRTGSQEKEYYKEIMDDICFNLCVISGLVRVNYEELSLVLKANSETNSKKFVHDIIQWIIHKNNEYSLSLEEVEGYKKVLEGWMLDEVKECIELINRYIKQNPNIDRWNKQNTRLPTDKIDYFGSLSILPEKFILGKVSKQEFEGFITKMFFFGYLCADGWITCEKIGMELAWDDRSVLHRLAKEVGLPESRVRDRDRPMTYKGETKWYKFAELKFGCKGMAKDLRSLGKFGSKSLMGQVPQVVKDLIRTSKEMEQRGMKDSELPLLIAKAWLYGFYDGDGNLGLKAEEGWISPLIVAGNIEILEDIYHEFSLNYSPRVVKKPGDLMLVFDHSVISKGLYALNLGADYFRSLVKDLYSFTHNYDLERKRAIPDFLNNK